LYSFCFLTWGLWSKMPPVLVFSFSGDVLVDRNVACLSSLLPSTRKHLINKQLSAAKNRVRKQMKCFNTFVLTIWCLFIYFYVLSVFEYIFSCLITVWFNTQHLHWSQTKFLTLDGLFKIQYSFEEKINTWNISI
jgi:hypothetical protein